MGIQSTSTSKKDIFYLLLRNQGSKGIYKETGSRKQCSNYRPISVISNLSKIFEKLLYTRFYDFLYKNNTISKNHFGLLPKYSTATAALHAMTHIQKAMHDTHLKATAAVFIDVAKTFDSLSHETLLKKLDILGLN